MPAAVNYRKFSAGQAVRLLARFASFCRLCRAANPPSPAGRCIWRVETTLVSDGARPAYCASSAATADSARGTPAPGRWKEMQRAQSFRQP